MFNDQYVESFEAYRNSDVKKVKLWVDRIIECIGEPKGRLLDVGCGLGRFTIPLLEYVSSATGIDSNELMISKARQKSGDVTWLCHDFLSFSDCSKYELILGSMVLEHIRDNNSFFCKCSQLMSRGGIVVLRTMQPQDVRDTTWYSYSSVASEIEILRSYSSGTLRDVASSYGFELISEKTYVDEVPVSVASSLPERIRGRSYQVLLELSEQEVELMVSRMQCDMRREDWRELSSSSILVFKNVTSTSSQSRD